MNEFCAQEYVQLGVAVGRTLQMLHTVQQGARYKNHQTAIENIAGCVYLMAQSCEKISLIESTKMCERLLEDFQKKPGIPADELKIRMTELEKLIRSEMESQLFLWIPPQHSKAYIQKESFFGDGIENKFPSSSYDIKEAGKSFACNRYTASVMHCMRALEHGLRALCNRMKVSFGETTWQRALEKIEARLKIMDSQVNPKRKNSWKKDRQFYSEAVAEFRHFKDAWRNYAAHGHDKYDEGRAENIINHTRSFLQHLSKRVKETKRL